TKLTDQIPAKPGSLSGPIVILPAKQSWERPMKRAAIYLRVSTLDQTTANQEQALREAAERSGLEIVEAYRDHGIGVVARFGCGCGSVCAQHLEQRLGVVKRGQQRTGCLKGAGIVARALPVQPIHQQYHHTNY